MPPTFGKVEPGLPLIAVFYWAMQRPELLPPYAVFVDRAVPGHPGNSPLGVNALVLTLLCFAMASQRLDAASCAVAFIAYWLVSPSAAVVAVDLVCAF